MGIRQGQRPADARPHGAALAIAVTAAAVVSMLAACSAAPPSSRPRLSRTPAARATLLIRSEAIRPGC